MNQILTAVKFTRYKKQCWACAHNLQESSHFHPIRRFEDHMTTARKAFEATVPAMRFAMENYIDESEASLLHPDIERHRATTERFSGPKSSLDMHSVTPSPLPS